MKPSEKVLPDILLPRVRLGPPSDLDRTNRSSNSSGNNGDDNNNVRSCNDGPRGGEGSLESGLESGMESTLGASSRLASVAASSDDGRLLGVPSSQASVVAELAPTQDEMRIALREEIAQQMEREFESRVDLEVQQRLHDRPMAVAEPVVDGYARSLMHGDIRHTDDDASADTSPVPTSADLHGDGPSQGATADGRSSQTMNVGESSSELEDAIHRNKRQSSKAATDPSARRRRRLVIAVILALIVVVVAGVIVAAVVVLNDQSHGSNDNDSKQSNASVPTRVPTAPPTIPPPTSQPSPPSTVPPPSSTLSTTSASPTMASSKSYSHSPSLLLSLSQRPTITKQPSTVPSGRQSQIPSTRPTTAPSTMPSGSPTHAPTESSIDQSDMFFTIVEKLSPVLMGAPTNLDSSTFVNTSTIPYEIIDWMANTDILSSLYVLLGSSNDEAADANGDDAYIHFLLERYCVASMYRSWNGPNWLNQFDAMSNNGICAWNDLPFNGIFCNSNATVLGIVVDIDSNADGPIPPEISHLEDLEVLAVFADANATVTISGTLPPWIFDMDAMTTLMFVGSQLEGPIPPEIGQMTSLQTLYLDTGRLMGKIPTELGRLTNLRSMGLGTNQLTGPIPSELGALTNLTNLTLYKNGLTGTVPTELGQLTSLVSFEIERTKIVGNLDGIFCDAERHPHLESLWSNCAGSTLDGRRLSHTVCSCCHVCCDPYSDVCERQEEPAVEFVNTSYVACNMSVYESSCDVCPFVTDDGWIIPLDSMDEWMQRGNCSNSSDVDSNSSSNSGCNTTDILASQGNSTTNSTNLMRLCLGACTWNTTTDMCEARQDFELLD